MKDPYILNDLVGYPFNWKYPPKGNLHRREATVFPC